MNRKTYIFGSLVIIIVSIINEFIKIYPPNYIFIIVMVWVLIAIITEGKPPSTS